MDYKEPKRKLQAKQKDFPFIYMKNNRQIFIRPESRKSRDDKQQQQNEGKDKNESVLIVGEHRPIKYEYFNCVFSLVKRINPARDTQKKNINNFMIFTNKL